MRIRVLPRDVAARIITGTVAMMGWAVGAATLVLTFPVLIETLLLRDRAADLPIPLAMLVVMLLGIGAVIRWKRRVVVLAYLGVGAVAATVYEVALLTGDPTILDDALYLLNRPTLALVAVGVTAVTATAGILWCLLGFAVANVVCVVAALISDVPIRPGFGPTMVLVIAIVGYLTFAAIQVSQRRRVPNFDILEAETQRLARGENLSRRTTAAVHDTLLNDLSIVMTTPGALGERAAARLLEDLETLRGADWISQTTEIRSADDQDATLRNDIMRVVSEFQWRGLTIHVTGSGTGVYRLAAPGGTALLGAIRTCLENVVRHSGATIAELELVYTDESVTVMITDQGSGFDTTSVPADRLGLRTSLVERVESVGGTAQIWSSPGQGTSIVLSIPILEVVVPHPEPRHQETS